MAVEKTFPYSFIRGKICRTSEAVIPIQSKAVQYGLGIFTGIRGNWNPKKKNLYLFRFKDHFIRLEESAKIAGMQFSLTYPKLEKIILELVRKNKPKGNIYLRLTLYASSPKLTPRFDNENDDLAIYMISLEDYFDSKEGLKVGISSWRRIDDDMISTKAKITGAYANSALAKTEAVKNGYDEAIFLNRDGKVCEATGANIFGIKGGVVVTPPLSSNNLHGITRRSLAEIIKNELNLELKEEEFDRSTLYTFDELFFTGTAAKIAYISSVDHRKIGDGKLGKHTKSIQKIFEEISIGENPKYFHWLTPVY